MIFLAPRGIGTAAERQAAGEPGGAAVVGGDGLADHAQSPVAGQRPGDLLRAAVGGAHGGRGRAGDRSCATRWWER